MRLAFAAEPLNRPPCSLALGPAFSSQAMLFVSPMLFANGQNEARGPARARAASVLWGLTTALSRKRPIGRPPAVLASRDDRPVSEALADRQGVQAAAAARGSGRLRRAFKRPACLDRSPSCRKRALSALCLALRPRRGGRVVECTALEMRHTGNRIGGSNPSLSASYLV
jgi:hypothetical protein